MKNKFKLQKKEKKKILYILVTTGKKIQQKTCNFFFIRGIPKKKFDTDQRKNGMGR